MSSSVCVPCKRCADRLLCAALLDELDKELNTYAMRVREWYGWHFPEMGRIVVDNILYAKTVRKMGVRTHASTCDLSDVLPEEVEKELKTAAEVSMGTELAKEDIENIQHVSLSLSVLCCAAASAAVTAAVLALALALPCAVLC